MQTKEIRNLFGIVSFIGTLAIFVVIGSLTGAYDLFVREFLGFIQGDLGAVTAGGGGILSLVALIAALTTIKIPTCLGSGLIVNRIAGKTTNHAIQEFLNKMKEGKVFQFMFLTVLAEEIFARWLFLGVLRGWLPIAEPTKFYLLMLIGNAIWALIHLANFGKEEERNWIRVVPQFIGGIFLSYVYLKYGLFGSVLAHFAYNTVLFSFHHRQGVTKWDGFVILWSALLAVVSWSFMTHPLSEILPWFSAQPNFTIEGWVFRDYLVATVFLSSLFSIAMGILCYDRNFVIPYGKKRSGEAVSNPHTNLIVAGLLVVVVVGVLYFGFTALGWIFSDVPVRIVAFALILAFTQKGASGSALGRTFWLTVPMIYCLVATFQALGFKDALLFAACLIPIHLPGMLLEARDKQDDAELLLQDFEDAEQPHAATT